jgi:3-hydroxyacyl-CoA dehydrogenase/enoyl-CoA hydratase/3-hydroxybutyryl-CoA epimerase
VEIQRTAVVGAGTMGGGIAYVLSVAGLPVLIKDIERGQLDLARDHLEQIYRRRVERGRIGQDVMEEKLALVEYTLDYAGFEDVDLAIEAVPEDMRIKRAVLAELDNVCKPDAIFASNTSALSISEMGEASGRPHRMVGLHFFNPAHVMKLVEVIPGRGTDPAIVDVVVRLAESLGKTPVVVRECPGFLVNRLLMPYLNEAVCCLQEGAATCAEIDAAMGREGFGWPMGPFALMDMLGLDVCHHILAYLDAQFGERLQEAELLEALNDAGRLGAKSGGGFYDYPDRGHSVEVDALVQSLQASGQVSHVASSFSPERLMAVLLNEAFLCVEEEIATVDDIDVACIAGLGMAVRLEDGPVGIGPLEYADHVGLDVLFAQMQCLESEFGPRFSPAPILRRKVEAGQVGKASGRGFKAYDRGGGK